MAASSLIGASSGADMELEMGLGHDPFMAQTDSGWRGSS
jgi:hypothetical protein